MCTIGQLLKSLDQRFPAPQEVCFKKDLEPKVVSASLVACVLFLLPLLASTVSIASDLSNPERPWQFSCDPRTWATTTKVLLACLVALNVLSCSLHLRWGWLASWNWELHVLVSATLAMVGNAFTPGRWALLLGSQWTQVFHNRLSGEECYEMLALNAITTGLCLFVPIRSCVLWVAPVSGLLVHLTMRAAVGSHMSTWHDVMVLIIQAFFSLVGAFWNERTARARFLAERDVKLQQEQLCSQYQAISRILARFCDCVLELDGDFRFCGPHRQFAALVLSSADKSLDGGSFLEHLACGRCHLVELLSKNAPLDQASDMVPLMLRDSQGREFAAQAYCACYEDHKGRHYFVGITETQERMPQEACLAPLMDVSLAGSFAGRRPGSAPSESSSGSSFSEEVLELSEMGEISFAFLDDQNYSITSCSPGFTALGGPLSQEQPLRRWMQSQEQLQCLSRWTQKIGNACRQPLSVVLSPPHAERAEAEFAVELSLSFLRLTDDSQLTFHVVVQEIRQQKRRRRRHKHRSRSERAGPLTRGAEQTKAHGRSPAEGLSAEASL